MSDIERIPAIKIANIVVTREHTIVDYISAPMTKMEAQEQCRFFQEDLGATRIDMRNLNSMRQEHPSELAGREIKATWKNGVGYKGPVSVLHGKWSRN